jgi:hypothetical protein
MIKKTYTFFLTAAAVITAWAAGGGSAAAQAGGPSRPGLTGKWQLNPKLSEDALEKLRSVGGEGGHAGRGERPGDHGPGHDGRPDGHGPDHRGGGRAEEKQWEEARNLILNAPPRFVLTQNDQKVVLTEPNGHVRTLPTNNRNVKIDGRDVRTKWENNRLVSETTVGDAKLVETYERSPSAPQLIVTARLDMHGRQVSVRRVYFHPAGRRLPIRSPSSKEGGA